MRASGERRETDKLSKVVAYLGSDQDGEVLAALRAVKRLMAARGQSLEDVLIGAGQDRVTAPADPLLEIHIRDLQAETARLRAENKTLRHELARKDEECQGWQELAWSNRRLSERSRP